jgi:hypothetical protein
MCISTCAAWFGVDMGEFGFTDGVYRGQEHCTKQQKYVYNSRPSSTYHFIF